MQVIAHAGLHCTDEDRVIKCLLKNRALFSGIGTIVPPPGRYRKLLHQTLNALSEGTPTPDAREILLDAILEGDEADRLLISHEDLFGIDNMAPARSMLYPRASARLTELRSLLPEDPIELFFAIRNPATFLPDLLKRSKFDDMVQLTRGEDPRVYRWSHMVAQLRHDHPDMPLTIWCNEDTPLIWAQIIREMAGLNPGTKIKGGFDLLGEIMSKEGMKRFRAYLKQHPVMTEVQKRRVMTAFLDKYARDDMIEEEFDLPGWTEELIDELTEIYDEDVYEIARMPGVNFILP
ncbi:hypothetical protein [Rhodalgimonas zhirmunskyi]|uniref:Uncharacterized protein n=1 Tax=Rhodalgimonas zhirmunskyi TaxID=2964767 RepID=A0AAJ1U8J9_9RHOB|nr:hypothetical protein [Rhodoalgimonas zhirmunskyi]MDQ2093133.1 hypothetical protein [Rhodoalgimonas zhirmunskyi]